MAHTRQRRKSTLVRRLCQSKRLTASNTGSMPPSRSPTTRSVGANNGLAKGLEVSIGSPQTLDNGNEQPRQYERQEVAEHRDRRPQKSHNRGCAQVDHPVGLAHYASILPAASGSL